MRIIRIITLFILTANFCFGQFKLKQMERCFDMASQTYVDSCFIMTDSRGFQTYIDLSVLKQIAGTPSPSALCAAIAGFGIGSLQVNDHVIARNTNGTCKVIPINNIVSQGALCSAFGATPTGTYTTGDRLLFQRADGTCYRDSIRWSQYGGTKFNCDSAKQCINSNYICQTLNGFGGMNFVPDYLIGIENGVCAKVDGSLFGSAAICSNLNLLGYSAAVDTVFGTFQGQCYKVKLPSGGTSWNCDSTKNCLGQEWFCDSIKACLDDFLCDSILACIQNDTTICDLFLDCIEGDPKFDTLVCMALHTFPYQAPGNTGDTVIAVNGGICYKTKISSGGGGSSFNCDSAKLCVLGSPEFCDSVEACLLNGDLFCPWFVDLPVLGINEGDFFPFVSGGTCWKSSLEFVNTNPTCLTVGLNNGTITSTLTLKPDGGIKCSGSGLEIDLCPYFATLPAPVPYAGQALLGQDCNTYTVDVSIDCDDINLLFNTDGGFLQENDLVLVKGNPCSYKKVPCWKPCDGLPDINPMLPRLQKEIEDLKKENKELRKLITDIQKKLK